MRRILLVILDGFGVAPATAHNAITQARTPTLDRLFREFPHTTLTASGEAVGTLPGQIGTSEVGHLHIGAGRVVNQDIARIHRAIDEETFFSNEVLLKAMEHARRHRSRLHLVGLIGPGGVHAHAKHLDALLRMAGEQGVADVAIHAFLDGRDTPPASGKQFIADLERSIEHLHSPAIIATIMGRFWGMDRNTNWDRTGRAFATIVRGDAPHAENAQAVIETAYAQQVFDEFIEPHVLAPRPVQENDSIIFFNFRPDRMRQLTRLFTNEESAIARHPYRNLHLTSMTAYSDASHGIHVAFPDPFVTEHLTEIVAAAGLRQIKIAETEKYAHLTYFFNGGREAGYDREERIMVPSPRVENFADAPAMAAAEITARACSVLREGRDPFVAINYANADMLGHTGNLAAAITSIEHLDASLARLLPDARSRDYTVVITADHGNAEEMYNHTAQSVHTAHTTNPVPFIVIGGTRRMTFRPNGELSHVAPTLLTLLGIDRPTGMTMPSLFL